MKKKRKKEMLFVVFLFLYISQLIHV